ncbi:HEAT repeat domain-containing protein [Gemmatimonas sp.]|uniref:HEAT repeat domain-containing protein n=1 Tax=Gemmatimonas sp. TaxID=1962908 RepID=UPI003982E7C9
MSHAITTEIKALLRTRTKSSAFESAKRLIAFKSKVASSKIINALRPELKDFHREALVYALTFRCDVEGIDPLVALLSDDKEVPRIRGQAAEGIAYSLESVRRSSTRWRRAVEAILQGLGDPAHEVRFWCVFAVATLKIRAAASALETLAASDEAISVLGWTVAEEAKDALHVLRTGSWPSPDASDRHEACRG